MKYIIPTKNAEHLGVKIAEEIANLGIIGAEVVFPGKNKDGQRHWPDGEVYVALPEAQEGKFNEQEVFMLHSGQRNPDQGLRELEYNLALLQKYSPTAKMNIFFANLPYAKQDKTFLPGEIAIVEEDFDRWRGWYKVKDIYVIDAHFAGRPHWDYDQRPFVAVNGSEEIMKAVREKFGTEVAFLAPDIGSQVRTGLQGTKKSRTDSFTVEIHSKEELEQTVRSASHIAAIDDFTETGGTLVRFHEFCKRLNPEAVMIAGLTHGVKQTGIDRTRTVYDHLYLGNSIDRPEANVNFTRLIMQSLGLMKK